MYIYTRPVWLSLAGVVDPFGVLKDSEAEGKKKNKTSEYWHRLFALFLLVRRPFPFQRASVSS